MKLCDYGCGQEATHQFKNGKWCCSKSQNSCPSIREKIGDANRTPEKTPIMKDGKIICNFCLIREGKFQLKNGKWCCEPYPIQCPTVREKKRQANKRFFKNESEEEKQIRVLKHKQATNTEEFRSNQSEALKNYYKNTPGARTKNSVAVKKYFLNESPEKKTERIRKHIESHSSTKFRMNAANKAKRTIEGIKKRFKIFSLEEEMRYNPNKPIEEKEIQVHCKYNECENSKEKGGWFTPTSTQICNRIMDLDGKKAVGGSFFYCSEECKEKCSVFNKKYTEMLVTEKDKELVYTQEEYNIWKQTVLEQDNYKCQKCGSTENLHCHHIIPIKINSRFALDPDNGIVLCQKCHYEIGHKTGTECSYGNLAYKTKTCSPPKK